MKHDISVLSITLIEVKNRFFLTHSLRKKKPVSETDYTHISLSHSFTYDDGEQERKKREMGHKHFTSLCNDVGMFLLTL